MIDYRDPEGLGTTYVLEAGRYRGLTLGEVSRIDPAYVRGWAEHGRRHFGAATRTFLGLPPMLELDADLLGLAALARRAAT